jgi:hypothetical protein
MRQIPSLCFAITLGIALFAGCGGSSQSTTRKADSEEVEPERGHKKDKDEVSEKGKSWGGWRYKGSRNDCFFKHGKRCFKSRAKACKAAGCSESDCDDNGGAPAVVKCK